MKLKPIKWSTPPLVLDQLDVLRGSFEDSKRVLSLYVDTLTQRNHVVDTVTGLTPIEQRNAFITDLAARGVSFKADVNFVTLAVTVNPDSERPIVFYFSPNAVE